MYVVDSCTGQCFQACVLLIMLYRECFHVCSCAGWCFHACVLVVQGSVSICVVVQGIVFMCVVDSVAQGHVSMHACCARQCFHICVVNSVAQDGVSMHVCGCCTGRCFHV